MFKTSKIYKKYRCDRENFGFDFILSKTHFWKTLLQLNDVKGIVHRWFVLSDDLLLLPW